MKDVRQSRREARQEMIPRIPYRLRGRPLVAADPRVCFPMGNAPKQNRRTRRQSAPTGRADPGARRWLRGRHGGLQLRQHARAVSGEIVSHTSRHGVCSYSGRRR
jgi:hypothetical protein